MKYARCARCELNYVEREGDICELCLRGEELAEDLFCSVCGENYADGEDGLCVECRKELGDVREELIEEQILRNLSGEG